MVEGKIKLRLIFYCLVVYHTKISVLNCLQTNRERVAWYSFACNHLF